MYQALYRKWRPVVFEDVLGQSHITDTLKNQIAQKKLSHAYLFSGSRGTGKTSTAKILARAVNCENPVNGNPCNECRACKTALNASAVDIIEIDAASNNRVDDVRIIRDEVVYAPADLSYKVYIIDEAHMLTNQAFNALLKTLEEPPAHVIFIFATTEPHKFPATILSRCQRFDFKRITPYDTEKRIRQITGKDGYTISDDAVGLLARIADGSMRDALSILDQCLSSGITAIELADIARITGASDPNFIYEFSQYLIDGNLTSCFAAIKSAYENGRDMERITEDLLEHFRSVLVAKTLENETAAMEILMTSKTAFGIYWSQAKELSVERLLRYLEILSETAASKKHLQNPRLCIEIAVTSMLKRPDLADPKGFSERLMELENQLHRLCCGQVQLPKSVPQPIPASISQEASLKADEISVSKEASPEPEVLQEEALPVPENASDEETAETMIPEFIPDYPVDAYVEQPFVAQTEPLQAVLEEPCTVESAVSGSVAALWEQIVETASQNADFGFRRIMGNCKPVEKNGGIELMISNEPFLNIARMNQYDKVVQNALLEVTGQSYQVKLRSQSEEKPEEDSFSRLLNKLETYQDRITFK